MEGICAYCGRLFIAEGRNSWKQKYCSSQCKEQNNNKKRWARVAPPDPEPRECIVCGKTFTPDRKHPWAKACSKECNIRRQQTKGKEERDAKRKEVLSEGKECAICKKHFIPHSYSIKFCSNECRMESRRIRARRLNAKLPQGERTRRNYVKRWNGNFKKALDRDGHKCRICGKSTMLEVHHINGKGEKQGDDHRLENLVTLCRKCHKAFHYVHLVQVDGKWYIKGELFEELGISGTVPVMDWGDEAS